MADHPGRPGSGRLIVVSEFMHSNDLPSAAGTRVKALMDFMTQKGWDVLEVVPLVDIDGRHSTEPLANVKKLITYETRRHDLGSPFAAIFLPSDLRAYLYVFRDFRPDVVLISGYSPFLLVEPLVVCKLLGIPVAYDVLDSWLLLSVFHPGRLRNWVRRAIENYALSHGDLVVGVTKTQVDLLERAYGLDPDRVMLVPRGADPVQQTHARSPAKYDIIHVGPPRDYYDNEGLLEFLVRLSSLRSDLRFAFLGIAEGAVKTRLEGELAKRSLRDLTDLIPPVPRSEVLNWTRTARAGVITSTKNPIYRAAISTKSFDYINAGIPILFLGLAHSEQAEFIERYGIGRVAETPSALANQANEILSDKRALEEFGANAQKASSLLAWTKILEPFYRRMAMLSATRGGLDGGAESGPE